YQRTSGYKGMVTNSTKLLNSCHPSQHHVIAHGDMTSQGTVIGKNTVITHDTVVSNMAIGHNPTIFPNYGSHFVDRTSVNSNKFAYSGSVTYLNSRFFILKFQILRNG